MRFRNTILSIAAATVCTAATFAPIPMTPKIDVYSPSSGHDAVPTINPFGTDALTLSGNVQNSSGNVHVSLVNNTTGQIYQTVDVVNGEYSLYFPNITSGVRDHQLRITIDDVDYYYDFATQTYNTNEYVDMSTLGLLELNSTVESYALDFDLSQLDSNKNIITGNANGFVGIIATNYKTGQKHIFSVNSDGSYELKFLKDYTQYIIEIFNSSSKFYVKDDGSVISAKNIAPIVNEYDVEVPKVQPITFDSSKSFDINISTLQQYTISGDIITQLSFENTGFSSDKMKVVLYDAQDGSYFTQGWASCGEELCSYSIDAGSGVPNGNYIIEVYQNITYDGTFSYKGTSYYLLNDNNLIDTKYMTKDEAVSHARSFNPGANTLNISMLNYIEKSPTKLEGSFEMSAETGQVSILDPKKNKIVAMADIQYGKFETSVLPGEYIIGIQYEGQSFNLTDDDGDYTQGVSVAQDVTPIFYTSDDQAIENLREFQKAGGEFAYIIPKDVKMISVGNTDIVIPKVTLEDLEYFDLNITVPSLDSYSGQIATMELFGNGITTRYVDTLTIDSSSETFNFENLLGRDDYHLKLTISGNKSLYYDSAINKWSEDGYYQGYQNGALCEDIQNKVFDCLSNVTTNYLLNFAPFTIDSSAAKTVELPPRNTISGILQMADYPNTNIEYITTGNNQFIKNKTMSNNIGSANVASDVKPASGYVMQVNVDNEWYFVDQNATTGNKLISVRNGYDQYGYQKESIKIDANSSDVDLGVVTLPAKQKVQFNVSNLDFNEKIFVSLKGTGDEGWYGNKQKADENGDANVSFTVPAGNYKVSVYPSIHQSGMIQDSDFTNGIDLTNSNESNLTWNDSNASILSVSEQTSLDVALPANNFIQFTGTIKTFDVDGGEIDPTGSICVMNFNKPGVGSCGKVTNDGSYSINRLMPAQGEVYALRYSHQYRFYNRLQHSADVIMTGSDMTGVDYNITTASGSISAVVKGAQVGDMVVLLQVREDTAIKSWEKIASIKVDSSDMNFTFENMPVAPGGHIYELAIAKSHINPRSGAMVLEYSDLVDLSGAAGIADGITNDTDIIIENITATEGM